MCLVRFRIVDGIGDLKPLVVLYMWLWNWQLFDFYVPEILYEALTSSNRFRFPEWIIDGNYFIFNHETFQREFKEDLKLIIYIICCVIPHFLSTKTFLILFKLSILNMLNKHYPLSSIFRKAQHFKFTKQKKIQSWAF
jgi:hypothetical protein